MFVLWCWVLGVSYRVGEAMAFLEPHHDAQGLHTTCFDKLGYWIRRLRFFRGLSVPLCRWWANRPIGDPSKPSTKFCVGLVLRVSSLVLYPLRLRWNPLTQNPSQYGQQHRVVTFPGRKLSGGVFPMGGEGVNGIFDFLSLGHSLLIGFYNTLPWVTPLHRLFFNTER